MSGESDQPDPSIATTVQDEDLWLNEGNIVIRTTSVGSPTTRTLYKVHKFILSLHCGAFSSLFDSGPQAAFDVGSERYDGLPVMDLPDADGDVRSFLRALYFPDETHRHLQGPFVPSFPSTYTGILRLSVKYDAPKISQLIVRAIEMEWPQFLTEWEHLRAKYHICAIEDVVQGSDDVSASFPDPAHAIRFATEFGIQNVLPVAFYDLRSVFELQESNPRVLWRKADLSVLAAEDLRKLVIGRGALQAFFKERLSSLLDKMPGRVCSLKTAPDAPACRPAISAWIESQQRAESFDISPIDWLRDVHRSFTAAKEEHQICKPCERWTKEQLSDLRMDLWRKLPSFFRIEVDPQWGDVPDILY